MKKIICTLLLLSFALSLLCACSDPSFTTEEKTSPTPSADVSAPQQSSLTPSESTAFSLLPRPAEEIFWASNYITHDFSYWEGIYGSGTLHDFEKRVEDEVFVAFAVSFSMAPNNELAQKTYAENKAILEAEGLSPLEVPSEQLFYCFTTKAQMAGIGDWLKERIFLGIATQEMFVYYMTCKEPLLPLPAEEIYWTSIVQSDWYTYWEGIYGSGTIEDLEVLIKEDERCVAFSIGFSLAPNNELAEKSHAEQKAILEADGLVPIEVKNEQFFYCFATKAQMAGISDWLKERIFLEVETQSGFVYYMTCEK